jgi:amino acid transporter
MTKRRTQRTDADYFARNTYKEVKIWDWFARIAPLTALAIISVCYFFEWNTALDLVLETITIIFFVVCFVWWYWAIYKIAITAKYIKSSQDKFKDLLSELRNFKKDVGKDAGSGQRREPEEPNKH